MHIRQYITYDRSQDHEQLSRPLHSTISNPTAHHTLIGVRFFVIVGARSEREAQAYNGSLGAPTQRGPEAEPLVRGQGDEAS